MATSDCPVGLQKLMSVERVIVKQKSTMFANKYVITDTAGDVIFSAKEDSSALHVMFGGNKRYFHMDLLDTNNQTVVNLRRPHCMGTSKMQVSVCGELASVVREVPTFLKPVLSVNDPHDKPVLRVKGPAGYKAGECQFNVLALDKSVIGSITRKWGGLMKEMFSDVDTFHVQFPRDLDVRYKAALIATSLLIDFVYYEKGS